MNFVYLVVAAFIFFVSMDTHADRVDQIEAMSSMDYCAVVADQFYAGAQSQMNGHARKLTNLTPMILEMIEHKQPLPKDAMYVPEFDSLNAREKQWMETNVLLGYDEAAKIKDLTDESAQKMTQGVFEGCMYRRSAQKQSYLLEKLPIFLTTASSEKLLDEQFCKERLFDINRIVSAIKRDPPLTQHYVEAVAKRSAELSPDRLATILLMIDEAYHAQDLTAWMKSRSKDCMGTVL